MIELTLALVMTRQSTVAVPPTDSRIRYVGRFDRRDPAGPRCAWSASTVEVHYEGKNLSAKIRDDGTDFLQAEVDGAPTQVIQLKKGEDTYTVDVPKTGPHLVRLVKRTEAGLGTLQYLGFELEGKLLPTRGPKRHIEIIGDSISCAFGNEGTDRNEEFKPSTENAYLGYGAVTGRELGADCTVVAWSGRKMWPDFTVPEIYDLAIPTDKSSVWEFKGPKPDAVLINLATNDFGKTNPDEKAWTGAYEAFIARLRSHYPKARIYCAIGPMMTDTWPIGTRSLSTLRGYLERMVLRLRSKGDKNVTVFEFPTQDVEHDGVGAGWHPNVLTDHKMGVQLAGTIKQDLGW